MIYLDAAASTPVRREVIEAMFPYLTTNFANPSSRYESGQQAARALHEARESVASIVGGTPENVIFTSGGTEANNLALKGIALAQQSTVPQRRPERQRLLISAIEHPSITASAEYLAQYHGYEIQVLPVDSTGVVHAETLQEALDAETALVSVSYANPEVGTVQNLAELASICQESGAPLHSDAIQAAGLLPMNLLSSGLTAITLAGHKYGAPKGVGAVVIAPGTEMEPLIHGGGQQSGYRSGTENVAFAVAFATALQLAESEREASVSQLTNLRDEFINDVQQRIPEASLTGPSSNDRLANNASFIFPGIYGESLLLELERSGIQCSSGSACAAGDTEPSPTVLALGIPPELAQSAVRFTLSSRTTQPQLRYVAEQLEGAITQLRRYRS